MSDVRKNTLVVDFSVLPERPQLEVVQRFVEKGLGIASSDLKSIQLHNIRHCVLIEMADATAASRIATENHLKYAFKTYPSTKIPVYVDDNTIDVRIHDLPLDLPNNKIAEAMQSLNVMLENCRDAASLLSKNIVKPEFIFKYLQSYSVQLPPESTKSSLIKQCLNFWRIKYGAPPDASNTNSSDPQHHQHQFPSTSAESSSSNSTMLVAAAGNMKNLIATGGPPMGNNTNGPGYVDAGGSSTAEPGLEQYPVNLLAMDFTIWFFLKWNRNSLDESAFWPEASCSVMLEISESQQGIEEVRGQKDIINLILSLKFQYSFQFVPNVMFDGCQGRISEGGVLVLSVGVVYSNRRGMDNRLATLGEFESMIGLRRDPHDNNNWKIVMLKLYIRYKPVENLPALSNSKMLTECLLIPLTLDSV